MMIVLYHGSNVTINKIDLSKGAVDKDFGKGFYLTDIRSQAEEMAKRRARIAGIGEPIVTGFFFDDAFLNNTELKVKVFPHEPCEEWAEFVYANRHSSETGYHHSYDIVVGPVADDGVAYQLERYHEGAIDLSTLAKELRYKKLNRQFFFGTERAIEKLRQI